ncbi:ubiquitin-domain-containing protein [Epithele typhae]|uniref:ubiquitin-domain-containing protein n=1 Tax=Epithele typhae TaxID=378194 RepID=UPI002008AD3A|nr:ubiquitin-domain-containing protein [Epithele typhae]KAH9934085.1 ubiquitin-domain-containing protein [Epithele typhae]
MRIEEKEGIPSNQVRLIYAGKELQDGYPLSLHGVQEDSTLCLITTLRGGKPVIYLLPPISMPLVDVSILLVPQWRFSHIYPLANIKPIADSGKERVAWSVSARPDGTLVEHCSGLELSYLFWEAESRHVPSSPPLSPKLAAIEHFDPATPALDPTSPTAVCLPFAALLPYLDDALKRLTLHVTARNDFITYWLPKLSKAPFVALRFLPQAAYARAAELRVEPAPDVVTRVFMLFRGVSEAEAEAGEWAAARARAVDGGVDWAEVVGVRPEATDAGVFRVLEWGAMEVL